MNNQILEIIDRLERLESGQTRALELLVALQTQKSKRIVVEADMRKSRSPELQYQRIQTVESIFHKVLSYIYIKRIEIYKFPKALMEDIDKPIRQAMSMSVLINQCSLRRCFKPVAGEAGKSPAQLAREAIDESNLVVARLRDTGWSMADTPIVMSPAEARQSLLDKSKIPAVWRGWTCSERMGITQSAVGPLKPPHDPSGTRRWEGIVSAPAVVIVEQQDEQEGTGDPFADAEAEVAQTAPPEPFARVDRAAWNAAAERKPLKIKINLSSEK